MLLKVVTEFEFSVGYDAQIAEKYRLKSVMNFLM
jgi:hypothetical protein